MRSFDLIVLFLLISAATQVTCQAAEDVEDAQVCLPGGQNNVCFPSERAAKEYFDDKNEMVKIDFGVDQQVGGRHWKKTMEIIKTSNNYMKEVVFQQADFKEVRESCQCRNELCSFWAGIGECEANPKYMKIQCAPSCGTCEKMSFEHRCPFDKDAPTIWGPGDLNLMFDTIVKDPKYQGKVNILSQPPKGPWVITIDDFLTQEQCDRLIKLGSDMGYERSRDVGDQKFDGSFDSKESTGRTSSNAWCKDDCYKDDTTQNVLEAIVNTTGIPEENFEYLQILEYQENQFYESHHDYIGFHVDRSQGVRILTVFLYLNDVEEGGGTRFTNLGITVQPKVGRVLIWPSVLDQKPNKKDMRTHHEAMKVIKGIKYGANAWIHQRDFKTPFHDDCQ